MSVLQAGRSFLAGGVIAAMRTRPPEGDVPGLLERRLVRPVRKAVTARDRGVCRFCGFTVVKYQQVALLDGAARSISAMATACIFCHDCFHLDLVPAQRSGVLVDLPEVDQAELHHLARDIYVARITSGPVAERARQALDHLMARRAGARKLLGTDDPAVLVERVRKAAGGGEEELASLTDTFGRIRYLPLDRRIMTEAALQFNQFPQILAFWRSRRGPYAGAADREYPRIARYLSEVAGVRTELGRQYARGAEGASDVGRVGVPPTTPLGLRWLVADRPLRERLGAELGTVDGVLKVTAEDSTVLTADAPFYDHVTLVCIGNPAWPDGARLYYLVHDDDGLRRLDGTPKPIFAMNARAGVRLEPDALLAYLRFFCFFVRGREGPFHLVESLDDPFIPDDLPGAAREALTGVAGPAEVVGRDDDGSFLCRGAVWYGTHLFRTRFAIRPDGTVDMLEHRPAGGTGDARLRAPLGRA